MSVEDLYQEIGGMGRFQLKAIILTSSCMFTIGWSMLQMTFAGAIPEFSCGVHNASSSKNNSLTHAYFNETMNECSANGTSCDVYYYKTSSRTVITEWGLVCGLKWTKKIIISIQMAGVLVGAVLCGQLGDLFGRKKVLYSFSFIHCVLNFIVAFSSSWIMFACFRFLIGTCIGAVVLVTLPYQIEFLPTKWRPLIGIIPSWSLGVALFASAAYIFDNWSYLHIACAVTSMPSLLGFFYVPESVQWLTVQGRLDEAEDNIRTIARRNKKKCPANVRSVLEGVQKQQLIFKKMTKKYTYLELFKGWFKVRISISFFYLWFTLAVVYYGISFGVASLTGNLYLNIMLLGIMEIPVQTTTFFFNNRIGRVKTTFTFFVLTLIPMIGCLAFNLGTRGTVQGIAINVFSQFAKMMVGSAWSSVQVWGTESFPTAIRNLGCGFQAMGARIGGIVAPLVINLDERMAGSYTILCVLLLIATILTCTLPDTRGTVLSDHVSQMTGETRDSQTNEKMTGETRDSQTNEKMTWETRDSQINESVSLQNCPMDDSHKDSGDC